MGGTSTLFMTKLASESQMSFRRAGTLTKPKAGEGAQTPGLPSQGKFNAAPKRSVAVTLPSADLSREASAHGTPTPAGLLARPSVVDESMEGPNVIERLEPAGDEQKQNLHKFATAREIRYQQRLPARFVARASPRKMTSGGRDGNAKTYKGTMLHQHAHVAGKLYTTEEAGIGQSVSASNLLSRRSQAHKPGQPLAIGVPGPPKTEYERIDDAFRRRFRGIDKVLKGNMHEQRGSLDADSKVKANG